MVSLSQSLKSSGFDIYREGGIIGEFAEYREDSYSTTVTHIPQEQAVHNIFPNPFNERTTLQIDLDKTSFVKAVVYNIRGRHIQTLINTSRPPGTHYAIFDGKDHPSGI